MKARLTALPMRAQVAIALAAVLVYAAVLWFVPVSYTHLTLPTIYSV